MSENAHAAQSLDRRIRRTRERLGDALIELVQEKPFAAITVQDVLERAEVGRSTFYAHFSDKHDLLLSDMDEFLAWMATRLARDADTSGRVAAVRELFAHVAEQRALWDALSSAGKLHDFFALAQEHFARGIEERLAREPLARQPSFARQPLPRGMRPEDLRARSQALAGALLALLAWWLRNGTPGSPERMDEQFHALVHGGVGASLPLAVRGQRAASG